MLFTAWLPQHLLVLDGSTFRAEYTEHGTHQSGSWALTETPSQRILGDRIYVW